MTGTTKPSVVLPLHPIAAVPTPLDEEQVATIVRDLAQELGDARAAHAVTATASLEREVGLGSLERVELLTRIEEATGRELGDRFLLLDSARDIAAALPSAPVAGGIAPTSAAPAPSTTTVDIPADRVVPPASVVDLPASRIARPGSAVARAAYIAGAAAVRAAYGAYVVVAWTIAGLLLVPPLWILSRIVPPGARVRGLARLACRVGLAITGCRIRVDGAQHVPREGAVVLAANHTSFADTPALVAALARDFLFVAMQEILEWPVIGGFVRRGLHPTVDRWHPQRSVADAAAIQARLREGAAVLFFPEGGFGAASGLRPLRLGAFEAAAMTGAAVVPIALRGTRHVLPSGARLPRPARIDVWIGEPLRADGDDWRSIIDLRDRVADAIAAHCGEPRLDRDPQLHDVEESV